MKLFLFQIIIVCCFAMGFRGNCYQTPYNTFLRNISIAGGSVYNPSDAGFLDQYFIVAGNNGQILRTTDPVSDPWIYMNSNTTNNINYLADCESYDTGVVYGVGDLGTIIRTQDQGLSWTVLNSGVTEKLNGIEFINTDLNNVIAVGNSGLILRSTNGGQNWFTVSSGVTKNLNSIYSLNSFTNFIAGDDGTLLRSSNSGLNWENRSFADTVNDLNKIGYMGTWFFGTIIGIAGDSGKLYRTTNNFTFDPIETGSAEDLYDLQFRTASSGYVAGENGKVRYTTNGGHEWFSDFFINSVTDERIASTLIINDTTVVGVAGNEIILLSAEESLLPVELSAFTYNVQNNNVNLLWTTASELNNSGFDIERSEVINQNPNVWNKVGFVNGNGTVSTPSNYEYTDKGLKSGRYIYRLKQIDFNGNYEYFNMTGEVVIGVPDKFYLSQNYPNPFNPVTKINYELRVTNYVLLKVYDVLGNEVKTLVNQKQNAGRYNVEFDGSNFSSGAYFYRLETNGFVLTKKMLLLK